LRDAVSFRILEIAGHQDDEVGQRPQTQPANREELSDTGTNLSQEKPMRAEDTQEETQQESGKDSLVSRRLWSCNRPSALHRSAAWTSRGGIVNLFPAGCAVNHRHVSRPPGTEKLAREMRRRQWKIVRRIRIFSLISKSPDATRKRLGIFLCYMP
jgi:hypothetical protein